MQITPSTQNATNQLIANLDPKVVQLINKFQNRPLLLEKLVLNQVQGVLLKLGDSKRSIQLQLPLKSPELFDHISKNNNQIKLIITQQKLVSIVLPADENGETKTVKFKKAILLPNNLIKLTNQFNDSAQSVKQDSLGKPISQATTNDEFVQKHKNQKSAETILIKNQDAKANRLKPTESKNEPSNPTNKSTNHLGRVASSLSLEGDVKTLTKAQSNLPLTDKTLLNSEKASISVANVAKQILKGHFSDQRPLAAHLSQVIKIANSMQDALIDSPLVAKLQKQVNRLLSEITMPKTISQKSIRNKIANSGHFFETRMKPLFKPEHSTAQTLHQSKTQSIDNELQTKLASNNNSKAHQRGSITANIKGKFNLNNSTGVGVAKDTKLLLLQIKTTLESMIQNARSNKSNLVSSTSSSSASAPTTAAKQEANTNPRPENTEQTSKPILPAEIPSAKKNSPQQNLQQSRLSNEAHLMQPGNLSKLANAMLSEVRSLLSQIETNQLLSLKTESTNLHQFLFDLPIKHNDHIDSFEMLFENKKTKSKKSTVKHWKIVVRFDLEPLGPMFAQVELSDNKISSHIFAEKKETAQLISENLPMLKRSLFKAGLEVGQLKGNQGKIPSSLSVNDERLVDTHI